MSPETNYEASSQDYLADNFCVYLIVPDILVVAKGNRSEVPVPLLSVAESPLSFDLSQFIPQ